MPCGCSGGRTTTKGWVYEAPSGQKTVYSSEIEAKAAQIRGGRVGKVYQS
jgi:hypothetical protein